MTTSTAGSSKVNVLGVGVDDCNLAELLERVSELARGGRSTVMYANIHTLNTAYVDEQCRQAMNQADVVYCDGAGVVWGARLLGQRLPERMTGADWIYPLCQSCAEKGLSLYLLGGRPGVAEAAARKLMDGYPGLSIVGTHHGYIHAASQETEGAIAAVNEANPDILLVGMGTPLQEKWIAAHRDELEVPVVWAVGALFDFVAGVAPRGPRWMLDHGLEWLYRLGVEPGRMWRRYVVGNPLFLLRVLGQRLTK